MFEGFLIGFWHLFGLKQIQDFLFGISRIVGFAIGEDPQVTRGNRLVEVVESTNQASGTAAGFFLAEWGFSYGEKS